MKKLSQILKEGVWDQDLGMSTDVQNYQKRQQDYMDPASKRKFELAAETSQNQSTREQLFGLGTRFIQRALARNPHLSPVEIKQLQQLGDEEISNSLEELYGEGSEGITEASVDMGRHVANQQMTIVADFLTQRVPEHEILNILIRKHKMDPNKAEMLLQKAKTMVQSGY